MFPNNMTGDPNQQNPSSIFRYDAYPTQNIQPTNWHEMQIPQTTQNPTTYQFLNSNLIVKPQMGLSTFSFGSPRPSQPIVQFPFQSNCGFGNSMRCKRKTESPPPQACKQHITEEKMAEHMSKLHISSQTQTSPKESNSTREQRLVMCEEMRKLKSDPILPQCLLDKIPRPCTALVLWQPPPRILGIHNHNFEDIGENNNENTVPNHNQMENDIEIDNNIDMDL